MKTSFSSAQKKPFYIELGNSPEKEIYPVNPRAICIDMKKINLLNIKEDLKRLRHKIVIKKESWAED